MSRHFLEVNFYKKHESSSVRKKSPLEKSPLWGVRVRVRVRLEIGLGLGCCFFFVGEGFRRDFFLEPNHRILIFCLNFTSPKMFLICCYFLSIFSLGTLAKFLLKSVWESLKSINTLITNLIKYYYLIKHDLVSVRKSC